MAPRTSSESSPTTDGSASAAGSASSPTCSASSAAWSVPSSTWKTTSTSSSAVNWWAALAPVMEDLAVHYCSTEWWGQLVFVVATVSSALATPALHLAAPAPGQPDVDFCPCCVKFFRRDAEGWEVVERDP
ncbi:uncharacterized protein LOC120676918 [Panicum virgatum]|uniref:uncharacterized protein LOC120676918 n=1 Tax=Panicum virgatum TaxID=38727 RepID=UPI0019D63403|nr:uncharacterized protein LOC120676918 [Panicum virgatum]